MNRHKSIFSSMAAVTLMALLVAGPSNIIPAARMQDNVKDENGFTNRPLDDRATEATLENFEALDKRSVEADPTAPTTASLRRLRRRSTRLKSRCRAA